MISTLIGLVSHGSDTWLVDSADSRHMTGYKYYFQSLVHKDSPYKEKLGDDYQYPIKGMGESFYKLDLGKSMKMRKSYMSRDLRRIYFPSQL